MGVGFPSCNTCFCGCVGLCPTYNLCYNILASLPGRILNPLRALNDTFGKSLSQSLHLELAWRLHSKNLPFSFDKPNPPYHYLPFPFSLLSSFDKPFSPPKTPLRCSSSRWDYGILESTKTSPFLMEGNFADGKGKSCK